MDRRYSTVQAAAVLLASFCVALAAGILSLRLQFTPKYADFIVGSITWQSQTKFQDLIVVPVFLLTFFVSTLSYRHLLLTRNSSSERPGQGDGFAVQLLWWSTPTVAALFGQLLGGFSDFRVFLLAAACLTTFGLASWLSSRKGEQLPPENLGLSVLAVILLALIPLEMALLLGRLMFGLLEGEPTHYWRASYSLMGIGLAGVLLVTARAPQAIPRLLPRLLFLAQLGLPFFLLALFPARLVSPAGIVEYSTTIWFKLALFTSISYGLWDVFARYARFQRASSGRFQALISPVAIFAIIVAAKLGGTVPPQLSPDDYHNGEHLLGWWSYLQGAVPYVDFIPSHGLIDDDLAGFISYLFYDGTAASLGDASRFSFALLAFFAFMAIYRATGSVGLAFVSMLFMGGRLAWMFITPFICLWFSDRLRRNPSLWLAVWALTAPLVVWGVPPQGVLLVAASGILALYNVAQLWNSPQEIRWKPIAIALALLAVGSIFLPLVQMSLGAARYVLENAPINQVAYGVPWEASWRTGGGADFLLEVIRMSWVLIPLVALFAIRKAYRTSGVDTGAFLPGLVILAFSLLLIPYSMGRIDPVGISRPGLASILGWLVLLPLLLWPMLGALKRTLLVLVSVAFGAALHFYTLSLSPFIASISPVVATATLQDGKAVGLPNLGHASVEDEHWQRLLRLRSVLDKYLEPGETYLDLTSRNAQYFYTNRRPLLAITAPYNLAPVPQQIRAVEQLTGNMPRLALLEGSNIIHDGGGLALRDPVLFRFVINHYTPYLENGFVIGLLKDLAAAEGDWTLSIQVSDISDANWDKGISVDGQALVLSDASAVSALSVGQQVTLADGKQRQIIRVWTEGSAIWLDGAPLAPQTVGAPHAVLVDLGAADNYRLALLDKAFTAPELGMIPLSWGRSESSLAKRMSLVRDLSTVTPSLIQLSASPYGYRVSGEDPQLAFDLSQAPLSGLDAGILKLEFHCANQKATPRIQVFWWGDEQAGPSEAASLKFTAANGVLLVPLDAYPRWLALSKVSGLRVDLDNASACETVQVKQLSLFQRKVFTPL